MHSCAKHLQYWCCKGKKWKLGNSLINFVGSSPVMIWLYNNGTLLPSLPLLLSRLVFSCQGSQKELLNLTQQDYMNRIEELNQSLKDAWSSDQKVKALKIVIQVSFTFLLCTELVNLVVWLVWFLPWGKKGFCYFSTICFCSSLKLISFRVLWHLRTVGFSTSLFMLILTRVCGVQFSLKRVAKWQMWKFYLVRDN